MPVFVDRFTAILIDLPILLREVSYDTCYSKLSKDLVQSVTVFHSSIIINDFYHRCNVVTLITRNVTSFELI